MKFHTVSELNRHRWENREDSHHYGLTWTCLLCHWSSAWGIRPCGLTTGLWFPAMSLNDAAICWILSCKQLHKWALRWCHNDHAGVSNHQPHGCLLNRLFRRKSKKTSKLRVTGLCAGNSPGTGEFPAQMASYAENVSIWWRHHGERRMKRAALFTYGVTLSLHVQVHIVKVVLLNELVPSLSSWLWHHRLPNVTTTMAENEVSISILSWYHKINFKLWVIVKPNCLSAAQV